MSIPDNSISLDDLPLRPELIGQQPYGAPQLDTKVCLNVNENPYAPSTKIRLAMSDAVVKAARSINRYPDREAIGLRSALASYLGFGLTASNIWAANGSNEIMTHLLQAFGGPGRTVLNFTPSYSMYPEYARNTHTVYREAPRLAGFRLDSDYILDQIARNDADIVVVCTPNNPTGTATPVAVIDEVCSQTDAVVIVDEAYQEFADCPEDSALALLPNYGKLVVSRTMSKAFALAGGRVGYLAAAPTVVDACRIVRLPYHLSAQTQAIAQVALANADEMLENVDALREQRQLLQQWLRNQGLQVVDSQSNFCLFGRFSDRHDVWQRLVDHDVLVREVGPDGFLRVSAGTPDQMEAFKTALGSMLPEVDTIGYAQEAHR